MNDQVLHNPHAGEILKEEFLKPLAMSQNVLAKAIEVPPNRIHAIIRGIRKVTANTDLRLCKFFGLSNGYFLRLQVDYEIMETNKQIKTELQHIKAYNYSAQIVAA
ncbi:MAG: XRE family plasmid maintenance system antidote protein [uncultured bacterium]|nr:MAG: XRE family plasmid maintenance system antidote protein [uncultured bacterium]